jgi:hypothetical protein
MKLHLTSRRGAPDRDAKADRQSGSVAADRRPAWRVLALAALMLAVTAPSAAARDARHGHGRTSAARRAPTNISINGSAAGGRFGGIGALSAGGSSRYLVDYPPRARNAILDYLFTPNYGAALQILKVEIGGDANSTLGAEASVEHTAGVVDCAAGYEFWLMREAKARNPAIRLYAIPWMTPRWTGSFWSDRTISTIVHWLKCARRQGLAIDYLGGNQNERPYDKAWTKRLRAALDAAGFAATKIVMSDAFDPRAKWTVANDLAADRAFRSVTSVVGSHDVCGYPTTGYRCTSTVKARNLGLPLWASELGAMDGNVGAASLARATIRGYATARLVGYITWPIVQATPPGLPAATFGLIHAKQPWSGNFRVNAMTYAIAMTTWFTAPGWRYVDGANGGLGGAYVNGSYTTLRSPAGTDWTTIAETTTTAARQDVSFTVTGGLPAARVHVWRTRLTSSDPANSIVRRPDIRPVKGKFRFGLLPGYVYTFTTLARSAKGSVAPPAARDFAAYVEQPDANPLDDTPVYLAPLDGAFQYRPCATDAARRCVQQMAPQPPLPWRPHAGFPYAVIGDEALRDYTVSSDVLFTRSGSSAGLIARFSRRGFTISNFNGYMLTLDDRGVWQLIKNSVSLGAKVLVSGTLPAPPRIGTWHSMALTVDGPTLKPTIDGRRVGSTTDTSFTSGPAGIEAGATLAAGTWTGTSWPVVQYRRLTITP